MDITLLGHPSPPHPLSQANLLSLILRIQAYLRTFQAAGSPGIKILRRTSPDPEGTPIPGGSSPCWQSTGWVGESKDFYSPGTYIVIFSLQVYKSWGFPGGASGKESACQHRRRKRCRFDPWVRKVPWRMKWQSTPVFLSGESHGQRSLVGYSQRDCKESDMTDGLRTHSIVFNRQ